MNIPAKQVCSVRWPISSDYPAGYHQTLSSSRCLKRCTCWFLKRRKLTFRMPPSNGKACFQQKTIKRWRQQKTIYTEKMFNYNEGTFKLKVLFTCWDNSEANKYFHWQSFGRLWNRSINKLATFYTWTVVPLGKTKYFSFPSSIT